MNRESIGGYFSLELPYTHNEEYHHNAIRLNSGRYCLEYILRVKKYTKVFLPYYMCDVILQPINKLGLEYQFYHIDRDFHIAERLHPQKGEAVLYCNYFGLMDQYVKKVANQYAPNIIIDNTQAFFCHPLSGIDTFYTCRKFFGVADGAYLYTDKEADFDIPQDYSSYRMLYLLNRLDKSSEEAFAEYHYNEASLNHDKIKRMSRITRKMMTSIDYAAIKERRIKNFQYLEQGLSCDNLFLVKQRKGSVPMVYPFLYKDNDLRRILIQNKIYVPTYWPNVQNWVSSVSWENTLTTYLQAIPIDQRYSQKDMQHIIDLIKEHNAKR